MSTYLDQITIEMVDSGPSLILLLNNVADLPNDQPALFVDLEGIKLSRNGTVSIITLFMEPKKIVYLIDVHTLGTTAFSTLNETGNSLKTIFESSDIAKVFFDVRNDSDALFSHYEISLKGVKDFQLMELASRQGSKKFVSGLAKCIERESLESFAAKAEWRRIKDIGTTLFAPEKGGRYEVFNERPLQADIAKYCTQDVVLLPGLFKVYAERLAAPGMVSWSMRISSAIEDRIKQSQSTNYDPHSNQKALGPW